MILAFGLISPTPCFDFLLGTDGLTAKAWRGLSITHSRRDAAAAGAGLLLCALEAEQGFLQKILLRGTWPLAIVFLCGFVIGALLRGPAKHAHARLPAGMVRSYVAIHIALVFASGPRLITGSNLGEGFVGALVGLERADLVSFLIVFCCTRLPRPASLRDPADHSGQARLRIRVFAVHRRRFVTAENLSQ